MNKTFAKLALAAMMVAAPALDAFAQSTTTGKTGRPLPRFASLKSTKVNVRVGPGTDFKIEWLYQKRGLPMEIIQEFDNWRKIRDPEGNEGWILHSLLSGKRTIVIRPWEKDLGDIAGLLRTPETSSALRAKLQPGVLGEVISCSDDWCQISVENADSKSIDGYVEKNSIWGVYPDEIIEE